jgi:PAS domain S-box-containing protein
MAMSQRQNRELAKTNFQNLFEGLSGQFLVVHADEPIFTIAAINNAFAIEKKINKDDFIGKSYFDLFQLISGNLPILDKNIFKSSFLRVINLKKKDTFEINIDDVLRWNQINTPLLNNSEDLTHILIEHKEINQIQVLLDSEEKLRSLLQNAHIGIVIIDHIGIIEFTNKNMETIFGYDKEELINQNFDILFPENSRINQREICKNYLNKILISPNEADEFFLFGKRKDGSEILLNISLTPSRSSVGGIVTAFIKDITEENKIEKQRRFLVKSNQILSASLLDVGILENIVNFAVEEIADGCFIRLGGYEDFQEVEVMAHKDPEMLKIFSYFVNSLAIKGIIPSDTIEAFKSLKIQINHNYENLLNAENTFTLIEEKNLEKFGTFSTVIIPLIAYGKVMGIMRLISNNSKIFFDESDIPFFESIGSQLSLSIENARLYAQANRSVGVREEIITIVSHDLRNPLTSIQLANSIFPKIIDDKEMILKVSRLIDRSVDQMRRMIEDLLDFAKIEKGDLSVRCQIENPQIASDLAYEMMKDHAEANHIKFTFENDTNLPLINYDKQRIAQVLMNLIGNAIKFTEIGGAISLSVKHQLNGVRFSVTDTGIGISKEHLPKIFDRYWQGSGVENLSVGLGLAINMGIVKAHGSMIHVESEIGIGSHFYFDLV